MKRNQLLSISASVALLLGSMSTNAANQIDLYYDSDIANDQSVPDPTPANPAANLHIDYYYDEDLAANLSAPEASPSGQASAKYLDFYYDEDVSEFSAFELE